MVWVLNVPSMTPCVGDLVPRVVLVEVGGTFKWEVLRSLEVYLQRGSQEPYHSSPGPLR